MSYESFMSARGFSGDPFAFTDSDREDRLADYFVPPPYFAGVMGTPSSPEPTVVFAPRGGGKSAQRRMVEQASIDADEPFLCITYSNFETVGGTTPSLSDHQITLSRLLTIALLTELEADDGGAVHLDDHEKQVLKVCAQTLLSSLTVDEYGAAMSAVKTLGDKAGEAWRKYGGVVAAVVGALMAKAGIENVKIPIELAAQAQNTSASAQYLFTELVKITQKLFWRSVYILIDRVDETTATTSDPVAAFNLVESLLTSLPTLEHQGVGFKFFLWDQLKQVFIARGGRTDRVMVFELSWSVDEISDMLSRRLSAFSSGKVTSFNDLVSRAADIDAHLLLAHLCYGSPRDMIRMAKQVIAEATRTDASASAISRSDLFRGVYEFSRKRTSELYGRFESDFAKFPDVSFVTNHLASDIFRISDNAMRQKLQQWTAVGVIRKMTELATGKNRPQHVYTFTDLRVVLGRAGLDEAELLLDNYALVCQKCGRVVIGSHDNLVCECGQGARFDGSPSLLDVCTPSKQ